MLEPLRQFICDECGQVIESPEDGYVEWEEVGEQDRRPIVRGFRIVHHARKSPLGGREGCYKYGDSLYRMDMHLHHYLECAHQNMFSYLYLGQKHDPDNHIGCRIENFVEFTDFFKRLTIPYYEEARQYFTRAIRDGYVEDDNEIFLFTPERLRSIIEHYS